MSFDENILLKIRREFSGKEKYRLFLQQLDRLESENRAWSKKYTDLLKVHTTTKQTLSELHPRLETAEAELSEYKATESSKKFVRMAAWKKMEQLKIMWETRFWELHRELQELKKSQKEQIYIDLPKQEISVNTVTQGPNDPWVV